VFGLGYLALVALGEAWRARRLPGRHLALLALAVLAVLVNPYGVSLLTYPLQYRAGSAHYRLIVEWASPDFHLPYIWLVEAFFVASLLAVAWRRATGWRTDLLCVLAFGQLAFLSVRNIPLLGVVAAPIFTRHLLAALPATWRPRATDPLVLPAAGGGRSAGLRARLRTVLVLDRRLSGQFWFSLVLVGLFVGTGVRWLLPRPGARSVRPPSRDSICRFRPSRSCATIRTTDACSTTTPGVVTSSGVCTPATPSSSTGGRTSMGRPSSTTTRRWSAFDRVGRTCWIGMT